MNAAALLLVLLASPPSNPEQVLRRQCRTWAADPRNAWALAHGLAAEGRGFTTRDGRLAVDVLMADFLHRDGEGPSADLRFANFTRSGQPVEPHPGMQVKMLLQAGVPASRSSRAAFGTVTLGALVEDLKQDFPLDIVSTPDGAWMLEVLARVLAPGASFHNRYGDLVRIDEVMDEALATLEREQSALAKALKAGQPQVPLGQAGIDAHPCGGLHYVQAVLAWARHAAVRERWGARLEAQREVLFYRLESESRQYDEAPSSLLVHARQLKFYGHWLETVGRYRQDTGWKPSPAQRQAVEKARGRLHRVVQQLEAAGDFRNLESLKARQYSLYLDLIGDSCHAVAGLRSWKR